MALIQALRYAVASAGVLMLAACGSNSDSNLSIVAIGAPDSPFQKGARLGPVGQVVRQATTEGLVAFDEEGRIIPALADRWIVTDDGMSYIFRLRDGIWGDGSAITAQSAVSSLRKSLAPLRDTPLGLDLAEIEDIRVMAGRVVEIRLARPMPHLLQLLAQPELGMFWNGQGSGPMRLERDGDTALLTPLSPAKRGLPAVANWKSRTRSLRLTALPASAAVEVFNRGDADVLLGGQIQDFPLASSLGISRGTIQIDPASGLFGLIVARGDGMLGQPDMREAIAMAIDREALLAAFGISGWSPTRRILPNGLGPATADRWSQLSKDQRKALAAQRVARWRSSQGAAMQPRLRIALPSGPGSIMIFERLRDDLGQVGIQLVRAPGERDADLRILDLVARYPRADWYLNQLSCTAARGLCSAAADQRVTAARNTADPAERAALLAEADDLLTAANVFIPLAQPIRWSLARASVTGFSANRWSMHPLMPMAMRPK